ncbi:ketoacyl-ACP synthase III [Brevibacillus dissolubilis]|uniref:ketoacyl-ACP synthase III n=1 Tax=Brevibacillus dissolubilis TaxID=1844116 RepID=UPI00111724E3|nr:ketoacyl-ACP synthase III [Brevibacillus dissolubilis]
MILSKARITAIGSYVPEKILSNDDLSKLVETNDEWITQRTGIKERRVSAEDEFTTNLAINAVQNMIDRYQVSVSDVDFILVCTSTPDYSFPSVASQIQAHFQIEQTGAVDANAVCAGFAYGLYMANGLVTSGLNRKVLVVGAETMSKVMDYTDRTTCILFGDGAGAVLVEYDEEQPSFIASHVGAKGDGGIHLYRSGLSTKMGGRDLIANGCLVQNGREVYRWAVNTVPAGMRELMKTAEMSMDQVSWFVPHSSNMRMLESICDKAGFPVERMLVSLVEYGNTSAASIPLSIDKGIRNGSVKNGDTMLLYGFGGGLTHAGLLIHWNTKTPAS